MFTRNASHPALWRAVLPILVLVGTLMMLAWTAYATNTIVWQSAANGLPTNVYLNDVAFGDVNNDGQLDLTGNYSRVALAPSAITELRFVTMVPVSSDPQAIVATAGRVFVSDHNDVNRELYAYNVGDNVGNSWTLSGNLAQTSGN